MSVEGNLYVPLAGQGRNINHDPRSRAYTVARSTDEIPVRTASWDPHIAPMDQGQLGRCVPTAGTAMLSCTPFWETLPDTVRNKLKVPGTAEDFAVQAYREVTALDPFPGKWEPDDTGSDGLSLSKLWTKRAYVNGYEHCMALADYQLGITKGPLLFGISWLADMDRPGKDGVVRVGGAARGGHEVLLYGYDARRDLWWCRNSWGQGYGKKGDFSFDTPGLERLISMQADAILMTPTHQPAPQPVELGPVVNAGPELPVEDLDVWALRATRFPKGRPQYETKAAAGYLAWRRL